MVFHDRRVKFTLHVVYHPQEAECRRMARVIFEDLIVDLDGLI